MAVLERRAVKLNRRFIGSEIYHDNYATAAGQNKQNQNHSSAYQDNQKDINYFGEPLEYYKQGLSIIPIIPKTKRGAIKWESYQKVRANKEQIQRWFEKTVNDIAILTGRVSGIIEIDIDGEEAPLHFHKAVETIEDEAVRKNIENTMKIKTGSGNLNYIFRFNIADFVDGEVIKTSVLWRGDKGHSEVSLKGDGGYLLRLLRSIHQAIDTSWLMESYHQYYYQNNS